MTTTRTTPTTKRSRRIKLSIKQHNALLHLSVKGEIDGSEKPENVSDETLCSLIRLGMVVDDAGLFSITVRGDDWLDLDPLHG